MRRRSCAIVTTLVLSLVACGTEGPTGSESPAGLYRLTSVNAIAPPFTSPPSAGGPFFQILGGELLLCTDRTFTIATQGSLLAASMLSGTYVRAGTELHLSIRSLPIGSVPIDLTAHLAGDSIVFDPVTNSPIRWAYHRSQRTIAAIESGTYRLTRLNGRTSPLVLGVTVLPSGDRAVSYVRYDSLSFVDGMFFTRKRDSYAILYGLAGDSTVWAGSLFSTFGTYRSGPGYLLFTYYSPAGGENTRDSLALVSNVLTRRTAFSIGSPIVEEYTRED